MSKKPVPSKKQAVSSTRSRHGSWVRNLRVKLSNKITLDTCPECGAKKRRHFACADCGMYKERQVVNVKKAGSDPIQEIEA